MYVRITKCTLPEGSPLFGFRDGPWYYNMIGQEFEVEDQRVVYQIGPVYFTKHNPNPNVRRFIRANDCEPVTEITECRANRDGECYHPLCQSVDGNCPLELPERE